VIKIEALTPGNLIPHMFLCTSKLVFGSHRCDRSCLRSRVSTAGDQAASTGKHVIKIKALTPGNLIPHMFLCTSKLDFGSHRCDSSRLRSRVSTAGDQVASTGK
jgi:hypothetical protein